MSELDGEKRISLREFCLLREKETGGFGATPYLPATLEDTYFALNILNFIGVRYFSEKTVSFLEEKGLGPLKPRLAFFLKENLMFLGQVLRPVPLVTSESPELEDLFYLKRLGLLSEEKVIFKLSKRPTLKELYFLAFLAPKRAKAFIPYVLKSQNPDGGFGFFPGTTSFIENAYFALEFLRQYDLGPKEPGRLLDFVWACWRKGAFARAPGGIPFLESTFYALSVLKLSSY